MQGAIVIQTCDAYQKYWDGFFHYMDKHWDQNINWPIYFCNEEVDCSHYQQIKTGKGTYIERQKRILEQLSEDYVFYLLEDFWPTCRLDGNLFDELFNLMLIHDMDALQISSCLPYFSLEPTNIHCKNKRLLKFRQDSDWLYNQQARIWRKEMLYQTLIEPEISERQVSSSITAEIACDKHIKQFSPQIYLYHHFWYPISGVLFRGQLSEIGKQMENDMKIDQWAETISQTGQVPDALART